MSFAIAKVTASLLESNYTIAAQNFNALDGIGSGVMGLTPDSVKARPDYRIAKQAMDKAFAELRAFNAVYVKRYKNELAKDGSFVKNVALVSIFHEASNDGLCAGSNALIL